MHLVPDNGQVAGEAGLPSSLDSGVSVGLAVAGTARIIWAAAGCTNICALRPNLDFPVICAPLNSGVPHLLVDPAQSAHDRKLFRYMMIIVLAKTYDVQLSAKN